MFVKELIIAVMPIVSTFYGFIITMFFQEHNPPHFHVQYGEYKAIITIKDELIANWELMQSGNGFKKIKPLD